MTALATPGPGHPVPDPAVTRPGTGSAGRPDSAIPWWRDAVSYAIYPRAFADSDGDGVGDLPGATARLGHLRHLGVDAVWITPFSPSPLADGGYNITGHTAVARDLGRPTDFNSLVERAHALGIKVLVDLVPNHTSDQHPWFREAVAAEPGSSARERYVFRPGRGQDGELPTSDWQSASGGPAWTRVQEPDGCPGEWYLHLHAPEQSDLNWRAPEVVADFERIMNHWLDRQPAPPARCPQANGSWWPKPASSTASGWHAVSAPARCNSFERGARLRCVVHFGAQPVPLDDDADVLLSSAPLDGHSIPQDTAVWITHKEYDSE
ncbi:hypothetical protein B1C81_32950 [Streptomyces sp. HG99]|nr:hypothetical protein B1C81_32950 [Streptomyces sp. HG99]